MSTHPTGAAVESLEAAMRHRLQSARDRLHQAALRQEQLRRELELAQAEEAHSREILETLLSVAREARASGLTLVTDDDIAEDQGLRPLAGAELRETIARIALRRNLHEQPAHWRTWLSWLRDDGFDAAGKSAEATFQTQLARSPLVSRADRDGVYILQVERLGQLRDEVLLLHQRLAALPPPDQLTLIGDGRVARRELEQATARSERALEEAWRMLTEELTGSWDGDGPPGTDDVTRLWRARRST